jgi:replication factor A1
MHIAELSPRSRNVNVKVHVIQKSPENEVVSRKDGSTHRVAEALVGDPSGSILMSLWNEDIALVEEGENYQIFNGYVSIFKNSLRLNLGRNGQMEKIDEEVEVNTEVNMSDKVFEKRPPRPRRDSYRRRGYGKRRY